MNKKFKQITLAMGIFSTVFMSNSIASADPAVDVNARGPITLESLHDEVEKLKDLGPQLNYMQQLNGVSDDVKGAGALSAAMASLKPMGYDPSQPSSVMAGVGLYGGSKAVAVGLSHYVNDNTAIHLGLAYGDKCSDKFMANASITFKFGKSGKMPSDMMVQEDVSKLQNKVFEMESTISTLEAKLKAVMTKNKALEEKLGLK